jgi:hypothetical protein
MVRQSLLEKISRTLMLNLSEAPRVAGGTVS